MGGKKEGFGWNKRKLLLEWVSESLVLFATRFFQAEHKAFVGDKIHPQWGILKYLQIISA